MQIYKHAHNWYIVIYKHVYISSGRTRMEALKEALTKI